ncbi:MAG TPA: lipid-binding SYLF domain-containing protein [Alphaproteobacteria bacterium]|nr:lipid-binding SYLF domain-containing protein [Alphaproteobacteria bacterium]
MRKAILLAASPLLMTSFLAAGPALSANIGNHAEKTSSSHSAKGMNAQGIVDKATDVANEMKKDPNLVEMMQKAKGIFIVPKYAKGGLIIGAQGGEGVLLVHHDGEWSSPVFYDIGGLSFGAQAGASAGSIAMLLMSDKAVDSFKQHDKFALNAEAGISVVKYSANGQATPGQNDVVVWSDTNGAYVGADLSVTDIHRDNDQNQKYYGEPVTEKKLLANNLSKASGTMKLRDALPEG